MERCCELVEGPGSKRKWKAGTTLNTNEPRYVIFAPING